jgi:hypothetical protein
MEYRRILKNIGLDFLRDIEEIITDKEKGIDKVYLILKRSSIKKLRKVKKKFGNKLKITVKTEDLSGRNLIICKDTYNLYLLNETIIIEYVFGTKTVKRL